MPLSPPPPPVIAPRQMTLLRIAAAMAWADGNLAEEEVEVMLSKLSAVFAKNDAHREVLQKDLREYLVQNIPLEELVPQVTAPAEQELVLRLGYEVIASSALSPSESMVNEEESKAYSKLVELLGLPESEVKRIEAEVRDQNKTEEDIVGALVSALSGFAGEQLPSPDNS
ncbi:MAG: TerB family tellurite resistance protein [Cyanobacteria bacterium P01_D01_bin.73]